MAPRPAERGARGARPGALGATATCVAPGAGGGGAGPRPPAAPLASVAGVGGRRLFGSPMLRALVWLGSTGQWVGCTFLIYTSRLAWLGGILVGVRFRLGLIQSDGSGFDAVCSIYQGHLFFQAGRGLRGVSRGEGLVRRCPAACLGSFGFEALKLGAWNIAGGEPHFHAPKTRRLPKTRRIEIC